MQLLLYFPVSLWRLTVSLPFYHPEKRRKKKKKGQKRIRTDKTGGDNERRNN
jgi:hypothetical protein